jgi:hypothetical protein
MVGYVGGERGNSTPGGVADSKQDASDGVGRQNSGLPPLDMAMLKKVNPSPFHALFLTTVCAWVLPSQDPPMVQLGSHIPFCFPTFVSSRNTKRLNLVMCTCHNFCFFWRQSTITRTCLENISKVLLMCYAHCYFCFTLVLPQVRVIMYLLP